MSMKGFNIDDYEPVDNTSPVSQGLKGLDLSEWEPVEDSAPSAKATQPLAKKAPEEEGLLKEFGKAGMRGAYGIGEMFGNLAKFVDYDTGKAITDWANQGAEEYAMGKESSESLVKRGVLGGVESMPSSVAAGAPGALAGGAIGSLGGPLGTWLGGAIGYGASGGTVMGLAEYQNYLDEYRKATGKEPDFNAKSMAVLSALAEGGFEGISNLLEGLTLGAGRGVVRPAATTLKEILKTPLKSWAKRFVAIEGIESATEAATAYSQALTRQAEGLPTMEPLEAAKEAILPAMTMGGMFTLGGAGLTRLHRRNMEKNLTDPSVAPQDRAKAVDYIADLIDVEYGDIGRVDTGTVDDNGNPIYRNEIADLWRKYGIERILAGEPINLDFMVDRISLEAELLQSEIRHDLDLSPEDLGETAGTGTVDEATAEAEGAATIIPQTPVEEEEKTPTLLSSTEEIVKAREEAGDETTLELGKEEEKAPVSIEGLEPIGAPEEITSEMPPAESKPGDTTKVSPEPEKPSREATDVKPEEVKGEPQEEKQTAKEGSAYEGENLEDLLSGAEREQTGRLSAIRDLEKAIKEADPVKQKKKVDQYKAELDNLKTVYEATYNEITDAGGDAEAMRTKIEGVTDNGEGMQETQGTEGQIKPATEEGATPVTPPKKPKKAAPSSPKKKQEPQAELRKITTRRKEPADPAVLDAFKKALADPSEENMEALVAHAKRFEEWQYDEKGKKRKNVGYRKFKEALGEIPGVSYPEWKTLGSQSATDFWNGIRFVPGVKPTTTPLGEEFIPESEIDSIIKTADNNIQGIKEELYEDGYSESEVKEIIEGLTKELESEVSGRTAEEILAELKEAVKAAQIEVKQPTEETKTETPEPEDGWRDHLIKARKYALDLGITKEQVSNWNSVESIVEAVDKRLSGEDITKNPNRKLVKAFKDAISKGQPKDKNAVLKVAAEALGIDQSKAREELNQRYREIEEAYEYALVQKAGEIAKDGSLSSGEKFEQIKRLYDEQPLLLERTSTSTEKQQFSTPLPLAYLMSEATGITTNSKVADLAGAGNGALLIGTNPKNTTANELDTGSRSEHLKESGYTVLNYDAREDVPDNLKKSQDVIVINPPFKAMEPVEYDGYRIGKLEHLLALKSLEAMKDDGRAAIIIGGHNFKDGKKMITADRTFFNYLYSRYNVRYNVDIDGEVYRRQGTTFPIRLLVVDGRKTTVDPDAFAPTRAEQVQSAGTFDEVREVLGGNALSMASQEAEGIRQTEREGNVPEGAGEGGTERVDRPEGQRDQDNERDRGHNTPGREEPLPGDGGSGEEGLRPDNVPGGHESPGINIFDASKKEELRKKILEKLGKTEKGKKAPDELFDTSGQFTLSGNQPTTEPKKMTVPEKKGERLLDVEKQDVDQLRDRLTEGQKAPQKPVKIFDESKKDELKKRIKERLNRQSMNPILDPGLYVDAVHLGGIYVQEGLNNFAAWSKQMVKDLGEAVNPMLKSVWATLTHYPTQHKFDAELMTNLFLYGGIEYQSGAISKEELSAKLTETFGDVVKDYMDSIYGGIVAFDGQELTPEKVEEIVNEFQVPYSPKSKRGPGGNLIPKNMASYVQEYLDKLDKEVEGGIDNYVRERLGYKDIDELYSAFSGEQIDAIAMSISQIEKRKGMIIGDQTGVGKGRVGAAIIKYANRQGIKPVFFTQSPKLFSDLYRDLVDIGYARVNPFILHDDKSKASIVDDNGKVLFEPSWDSKTVVKNEAKFRNCDFVVVPYSQIQNPTTSTARKTAFLNKIARDGIVILDESHEAAGQSNRGRTIRNLIGGARGVVYMSATYAKRPDTMPLYYRTNMGDAGMSIDQLIGAVAQGGVPFQQILAMELTKAGQYIRRELDFSGITVEQAINFEDKAKDTKRADEITDRLREIVRFSAAFRDFVDHDHDLNPGGGMQGNVNMQQQTTGANFASTVHNLVSQMLLGLKADMVVKHSVDALKRGEKPVITLSNTMETFLNAYIEQYGAKEGDPVGFSFKDVLKKALRSTLKITITDPTGTRTKRYLDESELPPKLLDRYTKLRGYIDALETDVPASPIDYIEHNIEKQGTEALGRPVKVGEITGRTLIIDYGKKTPVLAKRESKEKDDKNATVNAFNSGKTDAIVFNSSGATGLSLHSSEKFKDQRRRVGVIAQADLNIDTFIQSMGRINRKGQTVKPYYILAQTALPTELRPAVVLARKLASLNANISANSESVNTMRNIPDMMNHHGDQVMRDYLDNHNEIAVLLGHGGTDGDDMKRYSGKAALLPTNLQEQMFDELESGYKDLIDYLDQIGENDLVAKDHDFRAETLRRIRTFKGSDEGSPFQCSTYLERVRVHTPKKPFNKAKIEALIKENLDGKTPEQYNEDIRTLIAQKTKEYLKEHERASNYDYVRQNTDTYEATIGNMLNRFQVGEVFEIMLSQDEKNHTSDTVNAVVLNVKYTEGSGNPSSPSKIKIAFAVNDSRQTMQFALSQGHILNRADWLHGSALDYWDGRLFTEDTEERHIMTGNMLRALDDAKRAGFRGEVITYTTSKGETKYGLLMPRSSLNTIEDAFTTRVASYEDALAYMNSRPHGKVSVQTPNGDISISHDSFNSYYTVSVPSSRQRGAQYYQNDKLKALTQTGQFSGRGKYLSARIDIGKLEQFLKTVQEEFGHDWLVPMSDEDLRGGSETPVFRKDFVKLHGATKGSLFWTNDLKKALSPQIEKFSASTGVKIEIIQNNHGFPRDFIERAGGSLDVENDVILGAYDSRANTVYIVADAIDNVKMAEHVIIEEIVGHKGLKALLKPLEMSMVRLSVYDQFKDTPMMRELAREYGFDTDTLTGRAMAGNEFMVHHMPSVYEKPSIMNKLTSFIRRALRKVGFTVQYSGADIRVLMNRAWENMRGDKAQLKGEGGIFLKKDLGGEDQKMIDMSPEFSKTVNANSEKAASPEEAYHKSKSFKERLKESLGSDIGWFVKHFYNPFFKGQKIPAWKRAVDISENRRENRTELNHQYFGMSRDFYGLQGESLRKLEKVLIEGDATLPYKHADMLKEAAVLKEGGNLEGAKEMREKARQLRALNRYSDEELKEGVTVDGGEKIALSDKEIEIYKSIRSMFDRMHNDWYVNQMNLLLRRYANEPWFEPFVEIYSQRDTTPEMAKLWKTINRFAFNNYKGKKDKTIQKKRQADIAVLADHFGDTITAADLVNMAKAYRDNISTMNQIRKARNRLGKWIAYFPRVRGKGKYYLNVYEVTKDVNEETGEETERRSLIFNTTFRNAQEGEKLEKEILSELKGTNVTVELGEVKRESEQSFVGASDMNLQRLLDNAISRMKGAKGVDPDTLKSIKGSMIQAISNELKARGFAQHSIRRKWKLIKGYETTGLQKVLRDYITGFTGMSTKQEAAIDFLDLMQTIDRKQTNLYEDISKYARDMLRNQEALDRISGKARGYAFIWYLGANIRPMLLQLTQNYVTGMPFLKEKMREWGVKGASEKLYHKAMIDAARTKIDSTTGEVKGKALNKWEKQMIKEMLAKGIAEDQYIQEITGQMRSKVGRAYDKALYYLSYPFSQMEIFNRKSAGLAMFRIAWDRYSDTIKNEEDRYRKAFEEAKEYIYKTHYAYGKENLPRIATGGDVASIGSRTALTFRSFTHNYLLSLINSGDWKTIAHSLAYVAVFGGLLGLPLIGDILDLLEKWTGKSYKKSAREVLRKFGGRTLETFGMHGLPALAGANISGSMAIGIPFVGETPADTVYGVMGGLAQKGKLAVQSLGRGDVYRALENAAPEFVANPMKAYRMATTGATTQRGKRIYDEHGRPVKLSASEAALKTVGFNPSEYSAKNEAQRSASNIQEYFSDWKTNIYESYRVARLNHNVKAQNDAMKDIRKFNQAVREKGAQDLVSLIKLSNVVKAAREKQTKKQRRESRFKRDYVGG